MLVLIALNCKAIMQQQSSIGVRSIPKIDLVIGFKPIFSASFDDQVLKLVLGHRICKILCLNIVLRLLFLFAEIRFPVHFQIILLNSLLKLIDSFFHLLQLLHSLGKRFSADQILLDDHFYFQHRLAYKEDCEVLPIKRLLNEFQYAVGLVDNFLLLFIGEVV